MPPSPAFSIVIPTHDRAELLLRAVDSALASALDEGIEVLVVDDASTDGTIEQLQQHHAGDPRVRWLRLDRNQGPSVARNLGLQHASGEFVLFLDSDDVLLPSACALALAAFRRLPRLGFLTLEGDASSVSGGPEERSIVRDGCPGWKLEGFDAGKLQRQPFELRGDAGAHPGTLQLGEPAAGDRIRRSVLSVGPVHPAAGPFNPRYRYFEDWDFAARLCADGVGGHLDRAGFHREIGRADQLSNVRSRWRNAVMHQHVLASLRTSGRMREAPAGPVSPGTGGGRLPARLLPARSAPSARGARPFQRGDPAPLPGRQEPAVAGLQLAAARPCAARVGRRATDATGSLTRDPGAAPISPAAGSGRSCANRQGRAAPARDLRSRSGSGCESG